MKQKTSNEKINKDAEKKEIEQIIAQINARIKKCPQGVLNGSHQMACSWKTAAQDAMRAANSKSPTLKKLQEAFAKLDVYYPSDFSLEVA